MRVPVAAVLAWACAGALGLLTAPLSGAEPAGGVTIAGGTLFELSVPGAVVDRVPACQSGPPCGSLLLLVQAPDAGAEDGAAQAAPRLFRLSLDGEGAGRPGAILREPVAGMPAGSESLAVADLDGDGRGDLLVGEPGRIWSLGAVDDLQPPRTIAEGPAFDLPSIRRLILPGVTRLPAPGVGSFGLWALQRNGRLGRAGAVPLPSSARRTSWGLEIASPAVSALAPDSGPSLYLAGPEELGAGRLRTTVIELGGEEGATEPWEAWAQLPGAESVGAWSYGVLDGGPVLVVFTHTADKVGVFDQKRLRILPLSPDRTRGGSGPLLAAETTSHRWQRAVARIGDWNRDGRDDVAVAQVKGLGGKGILVELYVGRPGARDGGGFARKPVKTRIDEEPAGWSFDDDLDGDGLPDLLVAGEDGRVSIYTSGGREGRGAIADRARWRIDLPPLPGADPGAERAVEVSVGDDGSDVEVTFGVGRPDLVDLDSDGRPELVFVQPLGDGGAAVRIVRLER